MSRDFPDWVDPVKAAAGRRRFSGTVPVAWLKRLEGLLAGEDGEIAFALSFGLDDQNQIFVTTRVSGEISLVCQRSLEVYVQPLQSESVVALVDTAGRAEVLPENYEPLVYEDGRVRLLDLVEEELLLAMPLAPRKPGTKPVISGSGQDERAAGPFSELEKLRRN